MMMSNFPFCVDYLNREREEVPIWIASTGKEKKFQYGLLQQGFSLIILHECYRRGIIGAVFDVGRVC